MHGTEGGLYLSRTRHQVGRRPQTDPGAFGPIGWIPSFESRRPVEGVGPQPRSFSHMQWVRNERRGG